VSKAERDGAREQHAAYALGLDGKRRVIDATAIVVKAGSARIRIDLLVSHPLLKGQVHVAAQGRKLLVLGPGDASSIYLGVRSLGGRRFRTR
jgi:hypothetical protein